MTRKEKQRVFEKAKSKKQNKTESKVKDHNQQDAVGRPSQASPEEGELREVEVRGITESRPETQELIERD